MTRVAVAVVHYHAEALLEECLARLGASSLTDFRAVVVDNGSSASLTALLGDPRIRLVTAPHNLGFAAGVNRALAELPPDAPFLLLLNPDVQLETGAIETLVAALETEPGVGAASCALRLLDGSLDPACRRAEPTAFSALAKQLGLHSLIPSSPLFGRYNLVGVDAGEPHDIDSGTGALLLIRRDALNEAGGRLDERFFLYGEDLDLCRRLREAGHRIRYFPQASALHVKGSGRIRPVSVTSHFYRAMWTYYRKWGRSRNNPLVLGGLCAGLLILAGQEILRNGIRRHLESRTGS
jgi:GT2 family glycosyltransferase